MKTNPLFLSLIGSGIVTAVLLTLHYRKRSRTSGNSKSWVEDMDLFSTLRRVRSCKDATTYKDVVCQGSPKRDNSYQSSPRGVTSLVLTSSAESKLDDKDDENGTGVAFDPSYSSLESDETSEFYSPRSNPSSDSVSSELEFCSQEVQTKDNSSQRNVVDKDMLNDSLNLDVCDESRFHELLNSPIVEAHPADDRMPRQRESNTSTSPIIQQYDDLPRNKSDVEIKTDVIYTTYNSIVPPLLPNTGDTVVKSK